jgi:3',5'-nucleoside bisphosphate phosphatase
MRADLHTHSHRSDGVLAPAALVQQAREVGLDVVALTDHDSVAGLEEARLAGAELGVEVIAGVELSVRDGGAEEHLLGFFVDPSAAALVTYLDELQATRRTMAEETLAALERLGAPVDPRRVAELASGAVITRPHIARALVEAGHVASEQEAFERYLGSAKPAAIQRPSPDPLTAIAVVRSAGGVSALAHPVFPQDANWRQRLESTPERLDRLAAAGLQAVECHYPDATLEITEHLLRWTRQRGLIPTGGTDYHGPGKAPFAPLGALTVDQDVLEWLRALSPLNAVGPPPPPPPQR